MNTELNVLGTPLQLCCSNTGYTRNGFCHVPNSDAGNHSVCAIMTEEFLQFSKAKGNDLISPMPMFGFPGLQPGDKWCLCAIRWYQAVAVELAPPVVLESTSQKALAVIPLATLKKYRYNN